MKLALSAVDRRFSIILALLTFGLAVTESSGIWAPIAAAADSLENNLLGLPDEAPENHGKLVVCGGGYLPEEIYDEFIRLAGGPSARLVIIPTAYPFESLDHARQYYAGWSDEDVQSVDFLDTDSRDDANDEQFVKPLRHATGVWICGGVQGRLADIYVGTQVQNAIKGVLRRGGVVGGTSAGAAIMSETMIRYGTSTQAEVDTGLGLLRDAVVDQHFLRRNRKERLLGVLAERPELIGLGIDEATALIVHGNQLRVIGKSKVILCKGRTEERDAWIHELDPGDEIVLVPPRERDNSLDEDDAIQPVAFRMSRRTE